MNITSLTNTFVQSTDLPLLTALVLGLLVAFNPCQLSINISALTYLNKSGKQGWEYVLGRTITYTLLGWILMCLTGGGSNIQGIEAILSYGELILPYILIAIGVYLLYRAFHHHEHHGDDCHNCGKLIKRNGPLGSLILGMTLALAFCPESAIFFFGILLPLAIKSDVGLALPPIFAIGAGIPVLFFGWLMHKAFNKALTLSGHFSHFQQVLNAITGVIFILLAIMLIIAE